MKYKITVIGPAGSGKTTLIEHIWKQRSFNELEQTTIPTTSYNFIEKPIKLGNIRVNALDLGGQERLLEKWLSKDSPFKCFEDTSGVLIVLDFTKEYLGWKAGYERKIIEKIDKEKAFIAEVFTMVKLQNPNPQATIKIAICYNKWDLIHDLEYYQFLQDEFNKFIKSNMKDSKELEYKGSFATSSKNELFSPKIAVRAIMPHSVAIQNIFENFIRRYVDHDAEQVYFSTLNEDFLEIETFQFPENLDFQPMVLALLKSMYHSFYIDDTFKSLLFHHNGEKLLLKDVTTEIYFNDKQFTSQLVKINEDIILFSLSDIDDMYLFKKLSQKLQDAIKIKDEIYS